MLATRICAAVTLLTLAACADDQQFTVVPVPAGSIVGQQPVATSQPIVLYPARPGPDQSGVVYTQPQITSVDPMYGFSGSVIRAPEVMIDPLYDADLARQPPAGPAWVLPD